MNVLSLCDGMSCAHIALDKLGQKVDNYFASEIKDIAIKATMSNYPETIQIGDVNNVFYKDGCLHWKDGQEEKQKEIKFDLICFGSPCQSFSIAMNTKLRTGLEDQTRSGLFYECKRILDEVKPKYFLMENVNSMKKEDKDYITSLMGVKPILIDGADYTPAIRKRLYWTNIPDRRKGGHRSIILNDIVDGWSNREVAYSLMARDCAPSVKESSIFHRSFGIGMNTLVFKNEEHFLACKEDYLQQSGGKKRCSTKILQNHECYKGVRYLNKEERMILQSVPKGYLDCVSEKDGINLLGDGWQCDVIADLFRGMEI